MFKQKLFVSSHAPFFHNGTSISGRSFNIILAALPAIFMGIYQYGLPAVAVIASQFHLLDLGTLMNIAMKRDVSIGDGNAAVIGLIFAMLKPATTPWWAVITGTFIAIVIGKQIWGGIGCNPLNPALVAVAIISIAWKGIVDFDQALVDYNLGFSMIYPLGELKRFGASMVINNDIKGLFMGMQVGGIGSAFGLGLVLGGIYLMMRGIIRWEISISFLAGIYLTGLIFHHADPIKYADPLFHIVTGYTLIAAFFLITEDSSSPVNFIPMLLFGVMAGVMTVLIRNIGAYADGTVFAILLLNVANPLLDKIRPVALGKGGVIARCNKTFSDSDNFQRHIRLGTSHSPKSHIRKDRDTQLTYIKGPALKR
jgi:electron transport complex protein RnfD